ncbi:MAG: hypothetical protein KatS3mg076_0807 [Candidatus Binatia bacterium]|nr:MAG: hypothetical protein KatS3mg076_0807 [Candidatus Binatia bacterium]
MIVGDFNFTAESVYARELSSALPGKDPAWTRVAEVHERGRRVDHIWLRPGAAKSWRVVEPTMPIFTGPVVRRGGERVPLSDHCALAAEVRFENDRPLSREARSGS